MSSPVSLRLNDRQVVLPPIDASRGVIIGELLADAGEGLEKTLETLDTLQALQSVTVTEKDLADAAFVQLLEDLKIPEEERKVGLELDSSVSSTRILSTVLPVAMKELPEAIFNVIAALTLPNKVLKEAYLGGRLKQRVREKAADVRFGYEAKVDDETVELPGATFDEVFEAMATAWEMASEQIREQTPKVQALVLRATGGGDKEPSPETPSSEPSDSSTS